MKLVSAERIKWKMEPLELSCFNCTEGQAIFKARFQEGEAVVNLCLCEKCLNKACHGLVLPVFSGILSTTAKADNLVESRHPGESRGPEPYCGGEKC